MNIYENLHYFCTNYWFMEIAYEYLRYHRQVTNSQLTTLTLSLLG